MSTPTSLQTPSASQKVLCLPELLLLTINDLVPKDLHSAALVCHTWSEIALDYLWETAVSLTPLFKTLGPMRFSEVESNWMFVTDLSQANWPRFRAYARRIRTVEIYTPKNRWSQPVSTDSVEIVKVLMPAGYHLPKPVRLLSYDPLARGCAGPLSLNFLCTVSSTIKELYVSESHHISPDFDEAPVQDLYRRFGELETPSLESITLKNPLYYSNSPSLPNLMRHHASTIHTLNLHLPYNEQLWIAIRELRNLRDFSLRFERADRPHDMLAVLDEISSGVFPRLKAFSIYLQPASLNTETRRGEVFERIGRLTQLTSLKINSATPIMPYAGDMWHVGHSLSRLETLCINENRPGTGSSLISILRSFPHIKRLDAYIIFDSIPDPVQIEAHSSLEVLNVGRSPAPKARQEDVADFLNSVLPRNTRVIHLEEEGSPRAKVAWDEVVRLMAEA
ncbi:hypothetical protein FS837_007394 [Tulasnella sp. UAMH 9824]|nr:hypothetical protein FS837_007394 [Tulasnella sp. UAMH 9824]